MTYAIIMRRWGDRETHSYLLGVWDEEEAIKHGKEANEARSRKYDAELIEVGESGKASKWRWVTHSHAQD